ncbi:MAG: sensor histidine kinase [Muribaculaceae bacterium]|nr:sensor histidine kinase [Muribaculaceae bacterium]
MSIKKKLLTEENLIYLMVWIFVFISPILGIWFRSATFGISSAAWYEVTRFWGILLFYLGAFIIHNFFIAPILVYQNNRKKYIVFIILFVIVFTALRCSQKPAGPNPAPPIEKSVPQAPSTPPPGPPPGPSPSSSVSSVLTGKKPLLNMRDISVFAILIFAIGTNLGTKFYYKSRQEKKELEELEKENIAQELAYLRYQINPHFLMNTLNNIHTLVDIEPEKAKTTIVELSKMMRYILYDGEIERIPLAKEMEFIKYYVALMRLRFADNVEIKLRATPLPMRPDVAIAPLLLIPIIENAFKHGVSYKEESFIDVNTALEGDFIHFTCVNSKHATQAKAPVKHEGGVGLSNVRKRMRLIYGTAARMEIDDADDVYTIQLIIPIELLKTDKP